MIHIPNKTDLDILYILYQRPISNSAFSISMNIGKSIPLTHSRLRILRVGEYINQSPGGAYFIRDSAKKETIRQLIKNGYNIEEALKEEEVKVEEIKKQATNEAKSVLTPKHKILSSDVCPPSGYTDEEWAEEKAKKKGKKKGGKKK